MFLIKMFSLLLTFNVSHAKLLKVVVIDSGIDSLSNIKFCDEGHKDFTNTGFGDTIGHGTAVSKTIEQESKQSLYCQIIIKVYNKTPTGYEFAQNVSYERIMRYIRSLNVDIVNYSGGGPDSDVKEKLVILDMMQKGTKFVVAAGNNRQDLDKKCNYYPACYDKDLIVIGNKHSSIVQTQHGPRVIVTGNYGSVVDEYGDGSDELVNGYLFNGTSKATAIYTGQLVKRLSKGDMNE